MQAALGGESLGEFERGLEIVPVLDQVRAERAHRGRNFRLAHRHNPLGPSIDHFDRVIQRHAACDAVSDRVRGLGRHHPSRRKRKRVGRRILRHHADDFGA